MKELLYIRGLDKCIVLPTELGDKLAQLNWIRELEKPFYLGGLTFCDKYPYEEGSTEWTLESDPELGFKPVFCSLYHDV